jgi:hypothetical protein
MLAMLVVWFASRSLASSGPPAFASMTPGGDESQAQGGASVLAVGFALTVLPVLVLLAARPTVAFVNRNRALWSRSFDGILLMVPMFELAVMATCLIAGVGLLILFATRDRLFPRMYALLVTAQLGLLVTSQKALAVTRSVTALMEGEVPIVDEHLAAVSAAGRHLSWALGGYAALAPVALLAPSVRKRFAARPLPTLETPAPRPADRPPLAPASRPRPAAGAAGGPFLASNRFHVRTNYLALPFWGGRLKLKDLDMARSYVAGIPPLALRTTVGVRPDPSDSADVLRIEARNPFSIGGWYEVFDALSREKIGVIRWRFADDWLIHDPEGRPIGILTAGDRSLGRGAYHAFIGQQEVGALSFTNVLGPTLEMDYSMDVDQLLDRRLGVALGMLLFIERSTPGPRLLGP